VRYIIKTSPNEPETATDPALCLQARLNATPRFLTVPDV
jgi:hypothetical protein